jgi:hypothetical protein
MAKRSSTRHLVLSCKVESEEEDTEEKGSWKEVECHVVAEKREGDDNEEEMHLSTTSEP